MSREQKKKVSLTVEKRDGKTEPFDQKRWREPLAVVAHHL